MEYALNSDLGLFHRLLYFKKSQQILDELYIHTGTFFGIKRTLKERSENEKEYNLPIDQFYRKLKKLCSDKKLPDNISIIYNDGGLLPELCNRNPSNYDDALKHNSEHGLLKNLRYENKNISDNIKEHILKNVSKQLMHQDLEADCYEFAKKIASSSKDLYEYKNGMENKISLKQDDLEYIFHDVIDGILYVDFCFTSIPLNGNPPLKITGQLRYDIEKSNSEDIDPKNFKAVPKLYAIAVGSYGTDIVFHDDFCERYVQKEYEALLQNYAYSVASYAINPREGIKDVQEKLVKIQKQYLAMENSNEIKTKLQNLDFIEKDLKKGYEILVKMEGMKQGKIPFASIPALEAVNNHKDIPPSFRADLKTRIDEFNQKYADNCIKPKNIKLKDTSEEITSNNSKHKNVIGHSKLAFFHKEQDESKEEVKEEVKEEAKEAEKEDQHQDQEMQIS